MGRQLAGVDVDQAIRKAPADHGRIANDGQKAGLEDLSLRRGQLAGQLGCAAVDRKQAVVERRVDVAIGSGADHALLHVEEHEVDQRQGIVAGLSEIVQRLARRAELQAGVAPVGVEHLADDLAIGRGGEEAGGKEEFVVGVEGVEVAQEEQQFVFLQAAEVGGRWEKVILDTLRAGFPRKRTTMTTVGQQPLHPIYCRSVAKCNSPI